MKRKKLYEGLLGLLDELAKIHCKTIYLDGSFVTNKQLPSDIDICFDCEEEHWEFAILMMGDFIRDQELFKSKYHCNVFPSNLYSIDGQKYFRDFFQHDKYSNLPKGILKINL